MLVHLRPVRMDLALPAIQFGAILLALRFGERPGTIAALMILLATAGCNYIMGMPLGDDIMLNYQTTAFHDTATVRQLLNLRPSPEFERWLESMGIMANGRLTKRAGDPSLFF